MTTFVPMNNIKMESLRNFFSWAVLFIAKGHALTLIALTLIFHVDKEFRIKISPIVAAALIIDYSSISITYLCSLYQSYKNLKKRVMNNSFGKLEKINSNLLQRFADIAVAVTADPFYIEKKPTLLFRKASDYYQYSTYPIFRRTALIILKKTFSEKEPIDRDALAHECGHAFHAKIRDDKYQIPLTLITLMLLLFSYAIFFSYWNVLMSIPLIVFLIYYHISRYEARIETEADDTALKIIETIDGPDEMRFTAKRLIKIRIQEARRSKNPHIKSTLDSITHLSRYIDTTTEKEIIEASKEEIQMITNSNDNESMADRLKFEQKLIEALNYLPKRDSSLKYRFKTAWFFDLGLFFIIYGTTIYTTRLFSNQQNITLLINHIQIIIYIALLTIIIFLVLQYLTNQLWKKINYLINQSGL